MTKTVGIIAEYNPFHNGHYYHLQKAKQEAEADFCVAVISGNFTQRGETSIVNKWAKAYMAICGGADLVIELPTLYSVSSAENFANGAIKILDSLKIVDSFAFGAEADDLATLNNIANVLYNEMCIRDSTHSNACYNNRVDNIYNFCNRCKNWKPIW